MNGSVCLRGHPLLNPTGFGQAPYQPHPLLFLFLSPYSNTWAFYFLFSPISILASTTVRGLSASCSSPSPPSSFWPRRHLLSWIQNGRFAYFGRLIGVECIINVAWKQAFYVIPNTFFGDINKIVVPHYFCTLL